MRTILLYTSVERNFRSTLLGYLYDLQFLENTKLVVLYEKFCDPILDLLEQKKIFPNVIEKIYVGQYDSSSIMNFTSFRKSNLLAKNIINRYKPNLVIVSSDFHSIFELIICKYSKKSKINIISIACSNSTGKMDLMAKWIELYSINTKYKKFNKNIAKYIFTIRKYISHFIIHYLFPVLTGNLPFIGNSSYLLYKGQSGCRNANFQIVFSEQEKQYFIQSGVQSEKIVIIKHPYSNIFTRNIISNLVQNKNDIDFIILHSAELIGFTNEKLTLINSNERIQINVRILNIIVDIFPFSNIYIKFHPNITLDNLNHLKSRYHSVSNKIVFIEKSIPIEPLLINSKVVIDFPRAVSTSLIMNTIINPNSTSISMNVFNEFQGDYYKNNKSVEYITSLTQFEDVLEKLKKISLKKNNQMNYCDNSFDYDSIINFLINKMLI